MTLDFHLSWVTVDQIQTMQRDRQRRLLHEFGLEPEHAQPPPVAPAPVALDELGGPRLGPLLMLVWLEPAPAQRMHWP